MTHSREAGSILVGIDYSDASVLALREALRIAAERKSELHVLHVQTEAHPYPHADPKQLASVGEVLSRAFQRVERLVADELVFLQEVQRGRDESPFGRVRSHVRTGSPGEEIAQFASDLAADLVVVGTHGRTGLARLLLGSVAHAVVTLAPCPVLVVRDKKLPDDVPRIEPPCPRCVEERKRSGGSELWCEQHREHHGQRHTYNQGDRVGRETNFPLIFGRN